MSAVSANDVWAASGPAFEHWDGRRWTSVKSPRVKGIMLSASADLAAVSKDNVWAVGDWETHSDEGLLAMHWNGRQWRVFKGPAADQGSFLRGVTAISATATFGRWVKPTGVSQLLTLSSTTGMEHGGAWGQA